MKLGLNVVVVMHIYPVTGQRQSLTIECSAYSANFSLQFVLGGICTCIGVSSDPVFLKFDFLEFLSTEFVACSKPPSRKVIVNRLIQGRNDVTTVRVEPKSSDQGRRYNDAFALFGHTVQKGGSFTITKKPMSSEHFDYFRFPFS